MNLNKKHKLLSIFHDYYIEQTNNGGTKDISKSLSVDELIYFNKWSNENLDELYILLEQLIILNFIEVAKQDFNCSREFIKYFVTSEGKIAFYNKFFINQSLRKDKKFLIPVIISSLALLTAIGTLLYNISNNSKIEKLEQQLKKIEEHTVQKVK